MIPDWFNERFSIATDGNVKALFPKRVKGESLRNSLCNQDKKKQVNQLPWYVAIWYVNLYQYMCEDHGHIYFTVHEDRN